MARKLRAVGDSAEHSPAADTSTAVDEPREPEAEDAADEVTPDDEHAEQRGAWPAGIDVEAIARQIDALRAGTNVETVDIYMKGELSRFTRQFVFENMNVEPEGLRAKFLAEASRKFDDARRAEAATLKAGIAEARRRLAEAAEASQTLPLEAERLAGGNEQTRLLARLVDGQELARVERQLAAMSTAMIRRKYERTKDVADRHFVAGVEAALAEGRLPADDADELLKIQRLTKARRAGRVPQRIRDGIARLDELTARPTFGVWLSHVARLGAGISGREV